MIIALNNETHPEVEILTINIVGQSVDFRDVDGVCNAPYTSAGDMPTEAELKTAIEGVFSGG